MQIVIMEPLGISEEKLHLLEEPFKAHGHTFIECAKSSDESILISQAKDADVIILANMPLPLRVLNACEHLRYINVAFTGVDHIPVAAAKARGIQISNASGYSTEAVSELGVGLAIDLMRNIPKTEQRCRAGMTKEGLVGSELKGKTVGIVGLGKIGSRSAALFHAFGCRILAASRTMHPDVPEYIWQVSLEKLLSLSDIVLLHCPLNDSTRGMIDSKALKLMKSSAYLINLARGPIVNSEDLMEALNCGIIAGAAIDVFDQEPPLPASEPLLSAPNTILTPHIAFATRESMELRAEIVFGNLRCWMEGFPINLI